MPQGSRLDLAAFASSGRPVGPPGVDILKNIGLAKTLNLTDFYYAVKTGGIFDYKKHGNYENFGNYHYGVVGRAAGYSAFTLKAGAGLYQIKSNTSSSAFYGSFFDDPTDQHYIRMGIRDYDNGVFQKKQQIEQINKDGGIR